ncbi:MAG: molybdopterin-dependent oxidoreductase, partial [Acidobacteria bacterium]|nr:molybdopterin-dependent oxidoreductase [Acidobacteriota bacterium]
MSEIDRRNFLRFMLAGGAATMLGCQRPMSEKLLLSYVDPPEELIPGKPLYYASVCRECPAGCGVLACARDGRVVKVEGNPNHPVNQGTLCARGQAALQGLYDPDRVTRPLVRSSSGNLEPTTWEDALGRLGRELSRLRPGDPARLVFLSGILGPSLQALAEQWLHLLGGGRLIQYEVLGYEAVKAANRISFGREEVPHYRLDRAKFILSFGVDFLETWLSPVEFSRGFAATRTYRAGEMGLHVQVEPRLSLTGANADEWIAIKPGTEYVLALGLVHVLIQQRLLAAADSKSLRQIFGRVRAFDPARVARETGVAPDVVPRLARAFAVERPSLALSGAISSEARNATVTQVAVNLLNYVAGNVGETVIFGAECYPGGLGRYQEVRDLVEAMKQGRVGALLVHQSDPLFTMPAAAGFEEALEKVPLVVALTSFLDETAARAHLVLPVHVPLEAWDDYSPRKGILGLQQPAMRPLHDTRHVGDLLLELARQVAPGTAALPWKDFYEYLRDRWKDLRRQERPEMDFELFWKNAVMGGGVWKEFPPETVQLLPGALAASFQDPTFDGAGGDAFALIAYPSPLWYDGRGANKSWLQEIPHPLSHIVWDNWVEMHPEAARRLSLGEGDVVLLRSPHGEVRLPVHLHRWMRPDTVAVPFGQGHSHYGRNARNRGGNPISLLAPGPEGISGGLPWLSARVTVQKMGQRYPLVSTQGGPSQDDRSIAQSNSRTALMHGAEEVTRPETHVA